MPVSKGNIPWNKGLTALNNSSVAITATRNKGQKRTAKQRRNISKATKESQPISWNKNPDREAQRIKVLLIKRMRSMLERSILRMNSKKEGHTHKQLGYSSQQFKQRIESLFKPGMSWSNHGKGSGKWHIDHIVSIASFPPGTPANVINALENLQPLWQEENLKKGYRASKT